MNGASLAAIFFGAGFGAVLRWGLGGWLNPIHSTVPLGTLAANLMGGLLVGLASAWFAQHPEWPVQWRLLAITGFLGGLTTFSTFSLDVVTMIERQQYAWAAGTAFLHLAGSLVLTGVGFLIAQALVARA